MSPSLPVSPLFFCWAVVDLVKELDNPKCKQRIAELEEKFKGKKIIVGVDRLDYIKGVPQKLHAFEVFLTKHPEWRGKATPPRVLRQTHSFWM